MRTGFVTCACADEVSKGELRFQKNTWLSSEMLCKERASLNPECVRLTFRDNCSFMNLTEVASDAATASRLFELGKFFPPFGTSAISRLEPMSWLRGWLYPAGRRNLRRDRQILPQV